MIFTDCGKFEQVEIPSIYLIQHHTHRIVIFNLVKNNILTISRYSSKQEKNIFTDVLYNLHQGFGTQRHCCMENCNSASSISIVKFQSQEKTHLHAIFWYISFEGLLSLMYYSFGVDRGNSILKST